MSEQLTSADVDRIEAAAKAATPELKISYDGSSLETDNGWIADVNPEPDIQFFATARADTLALVAALRAAWDTEKWLRRLVECSTIEQEAEVYAEWATANPAEPDPSAASDEATGE